MLGNYHRDGGTPKISTLAANGHPHVSRSGGRVRKVEPARRTTLPIFLHGERLYVNALPVFFVASWVLGLISEDRVLAGINVL